VLFARGLVLGPLGQFKTARVREFWLALSQRLSYPRAGDWEMEECLLTHVDWLDCDHIAVVVLK
jgi:hypothetical protein